MFTIDLFSGCGGLSLGFRNAGFESILASDIDENCEKTLRTFTRAFYDHYSISCVQIRFGESGSRGNDGHDGCY